MKGVLATTIVAGAAGGAFAVDQNLFNFLAALASVIVMVLAVIKYLDAKIEHKITNATSIIMLQIQALRREIRLEISATRELMGHAPLPAESKSDEEAA